MQPLVQSGNNETLKPPFESIPHLQLTDPADLYIALSRSAPIAFCRSLVADSDVLHQVGIVEIGSTVITSQAGTPTEFLVEDTPNFHLVACFQGSLQLDTAAGNHTLSPNDAVLIPPGRRHSNGAHSLGAVTLNPTAVANAATAIAGNTHHPSLSSGSVDAPGLLAEKDRKMLFSLLRHIDACHAISPHLTHHLALDDGLHRTAALLLHPELLEREPLDLHRWRERAGRRTFDDLIDYIRANLDQRLSLSDLEARSHYSRRALQYAFRQRLNASPKQWIREQRLTLALARLRQDGQQPSIKEVALACGYSHVGHFTKDFKTRFGLSPSEARRT